MTKLLFPTQRKYTILLVAEMVYSCISDVVDEGVAGMIPPNILEIERYVRKISHAAKALTTVFLLSPPPPNGCNRCKVAYYFE